MFVFLVDQIYRFFTQIKEVGHPSFTYYYEAQKGGFSSRKLANVAQVLQIRKSRLSPIHSRFPRNR